MSSVLVGRRGQRIDPVGYDDDDEDFEEQFFRADIISVSDPEERDRFGFQEASQEITALLLDGPDRGKAIEFEHFVNLLNPNTAAFEPGDKVVLVRSAFNEKASYDIYEPYRLGSLALADICRAGASGFP